MTRTKFITVRLRANTRKKLERVRRDLSKPRREVSLVDVADLAADALASMTPEQRIDTVWTLTKACMGWNNEVDDEPRLRKDVVKVTRRRP